MSNLYASIQQEPPPMGKYGEHGSNGGRPSVWAAALAPLRLKPGAWHRMVRPFPPATASYITNGRAAGIVAGEFEATTRAEVDGVHAPKGKTFLFVRYVGQF